MRFKRLLPLLLIALTLLLSACSAGVISTEPSESATTAESTAIISTTTTTEATTETTASTTQSTTAATTKPTTEKKTTEKKTTVKATETTTEATTETTTQAKQCTVTVECKSLLKQKDKLKEGHEKYVPENGYLLKKYAVTLQKGDSVYDVLKRAAKKNGLKITARDSAYGVYIAGINNLDEKDAGATSGWTYYVNGEFAPYTCEQYAVKDGDSIVFSYSVTP